MLLYFIDEYAIVLYRYNVTAVMNGYTSNALESLQKNPAETSSLIILDLTVLNVLLLHLMIFD